MKSRFVVAQMEQNGDPEINLENARKAVAEAVEYYHADFIVFPECFMSLYPAGTPHETQLASAQTLDGPFATEMKKLAKDNHVWIAFGMNEKVDNPADLRNHNTTMIIDSEGEIKGVYRKTHLYDAFGYKESDTICPGDKLFDPIDTPFGKIGLFVCYEVRFPEVARDQVLKGADIILMPTAWASGPLKSHQFKTLITARAIENTAYIVAADQVGVNSMGESIIVDPMGVAVASAGETPQLICATIDTDRIKQVRAKLPSFKDRRPYLYLVK